MPPSVRAQSSFGHLDPGNGEEARSVVSRRDFLRLCTMAAAAVGISGSMAAQIVEAAAKGLKPSVIWLHFQECTGCTESLLRTSHPALAELILDLISLDYHETLLAAAGHQAEAALKSAMAANKGKYVLRRRGRDPDQGQRHLLHDRRPDGARHRERGRRQGRRDHRHRVVRLLGRHPLGRPEPDRRHRRARRAQGQDGRHHPRLPGEPLQLPRHRAPVRDLRHAARARRARAPEVRLRPARSTSTARAARTSTPAASPQTVRRRGPPPGLLPVQAGLQGTGRPTPTARSTASARWPTPGRSASGTPASAAPSRQLAFRVAMHSTVDIDAADAARHLPAGPRASRAA